MRRGIWAVGAAAAVLAGVALWRLAPPAQPDSGPPGLGPPGSGTSAGRCAGVTDERQRAVCHGVWIRAARHGQFVPQGLAIGANKVAFVSGFRWGRVGHRPCQLAAVDRDSGRTLAWFPELSGTDPFGHAAACKHGGGMAGSDEGLWLAETWRLWLLDPDAVRAGRLGEPRIWLLQRPVKGSTAVLREGRSGPELGLVGWQDTEPGRTYWYALDDVLAPGIHSLGTHAVPGVAGPVEQTSVRRRVQGAAAGPGGVWYAASTTYCGMLHAPGGRRLAFIPGAEGLAFEGRRLWLVSESGSRLYQRQGGRPRVPTLMSLRVDRLDPDLPTGCSWDPR